MFADMSTNYSLMDGLIQDWGIVQEMIHIAVEISEAKPKVRLIKVTRESKIPGILGLTDSKSGLYYLERSEELLATYKIVVDEPFSWIHAALQCTLEMRNFVREFNRPALRFKIKY
jgi:hypothetical protein